MGASSSLYIWKVGDNPETTTAVNFVTISPPAGFEGTIPVKVYIVDHDMDIERNIYVTTRPSVTRVNDTFCLEDTERAAVLGMTTTSDCYFNWLEQGGSEDTINLWWRGFPVDTTFKVWVSKYPITHDGYDNACYTEDSASIVVIKEADFSVSGTTPACVGDSIELSVNNTHQDSLVIWMPVNDTGQAISVEISVPGENTFRVVAFDRRGCRGEKSYTLVGLPTPTDARILVNGIENAENAEVCRGASAQLSVVGGSGWLWLHSQDTTSQDSIFPREETLYEVLVYADSARSACSIKLSQTIDVRNCDIVYFPTAISLSSQVTVDDEICGGTRSNRIFKPIGIKQDFCKYYFAVFNRWGQMIFESHDFCIGWNGTHQGENVRPGTYMYVFRLTNRADVWEKRGTVTVVD